MRARYLLADVSFHMQRNYVKARTEMAAQLVSGAAICAQALSTDHCRLRALQCCCHASRGSHR